MAISDEGALATEDDVRGFYRFVLRREPESEAVIRHAVGQNFWRLFRQYLVSDEFVHQVQKPIEGGRYTDVSIRAPNPLAVDFVVKRVPLSAETLAHLPSLRTWLELYYAVLTDPECALYLAMPMEWLKATDQGRVAVRGEVWGSDGHVVLGWAKGRLEQTLPAHVELWTEWGRVSQGCATLYDGRLEGFFPDNPNCAFRLVLPRADRDRILKLEVREASSGGVIGAFELHQAAVDRGSLGQVEQRLSLMEQGLSDIRAQLPTLAQQSSNLLENYGWHYKSWLSEPFAEPFFVDASVEVVIDAVGLDGIAVDACLRSVLKQSHHRVSAYVVTDREHLPLMQDAARRMSLEFGTEVAAHTVKTIPADASSDYVMVLSGRSLLHRDAVGAMVHHLRTHNEAQAVYSDEDSLSHPHGIDEGTNHVHPRFKPKLDVDLLWQDPYVGTALTMTAAAWSQVRADIVYGGALASQAALALMGDEATQINHLPYVLSSWQGEKGISEDAKVWPLRVQSVRARHGVSARFVTQNDELGAPSRAGVGRLVWPVEPGCVASVIIPTHNRLDLLKPCIESLVERSKANKANLELIIIDHASDDAETMAYLKRIQRWPRVKIMLFKGVFNWALMNNQAAEMASGEVLIFLNNDTLAISETWLDELVGQALRPGVGAVGCRLVYPDGSLQHGGFIASPRRDAFLRHEGLGSLASDGGYLGRHAVVRQTTAVTGACMAVSKFAFERVGGFEAAAFPVDGNDVDFCLRARRMGMRILYTPYASLYHLESKSRGFGEQQRRAFETSSARLWDRWGRLFGDDPFYNVNFDRSAGAFERLRRV